MPDFDSSNDHPFWINPLGTESVNPISSYCNPLQVVISKQRTDSLFDIYIPSWHIKLIVYLICYILFMGEKFFVVHPQLRSTSTLPVIAKIVLNMQNIWTKVVPGLPLLSNISFYHTGTVYEILILHILMALLAQPTLLFMIFLT